MLRYIRGVLPYTPVRLPTGVLRYTSGVLRYTRGVSYTPVRLPTGVLRYPRPLCLECDQRRPLQHGTTGGLP